jgi:hypothetical protein
MEKDKERAVVFESTCLSCQVDVSGSSELGDEGIVDPCTPEALIIRSQRRDLFDEQGQWTFIGNMKKSKPKVSQ